MFPVDHVLLGRWKGRGGEKQKPTSNQETWGCSQNRTAANVPSTAWSFFNFLDLRFSAPSTSCFSLNSFFRNVLFFLSSSSGLPSSERNKAGRRSLKLPRVKKYEYLMRFYKYIFPLLTAAFSKNMEISPHFSLASSAEICLILHSQNQVPINMRLSG